MSRYRPYPKYKDSGVEWLGEVPDEWNIVRNKQVFKFIKNSVGENSSDYLLLSLTLNGIIPRDIESGKGKFPAEFNTYQEVHKNDLIFCLFDIDETPRTIGLSEYFGMITGAYNVARCNQGINSKYVYYYYLSVDEYKRLKPFYTGLRKVVRTETFLNIEFALPSLKEQQSIANFLDNATCKIDTLIQKQQNLIELLKEKRQALISHAVTKGLNPHVKMKDSGVEWLGKVPEHWESVCLKWIAKIYSGGTPDKTNFSYWEEGTIPWISSGEVNQFFITEPTTYITEEAYEKSSAKWIPKNALVMALAGQGKTKGMVAQLGIMTTCNQSMAAIVLSENVSERFIFWWLTSNYEKIRNLAGGDLRDGLNLDIIGSIVCPYFLLSEQQQIANYLDKSTCKIDTLIAKAQKAIELLKERRTALISAVVTGKIDVRNANE